MLAPVLWISQAFVIIKVVLLYHYKWLFREFDDLLQAFVSCLVDLYHSCDSILCLGALISILSGTQQGKSVFCRIMLQRVTSDSLEMYAF